VGASARVLGAAVDNVVLGPPDNITKGRDELGGVAVAEGNQHGHDVVRPSVDGTVTGVNIATV
jgi:hypothetical protein